MELPSPPDDPELKNIIDKLANFVARNGPEFENMTKQKQKDNPKFSFLYGGEYFNYYQYKVTTEQQYWSPHKDTGNNRLQPVTSQLGDITLTSRMLDFHGNMTKSLAKPTTVTLGTPIALKKAQQQAAAQQAIQSLPWQQASQMQQPPVSMAPQIVSSPFQSLQQAPPSITSSQLPPHSIPMQSPQHPASMITSAGLQPLQVPASLQSVGSLQPGGQLQPTMVSMQAGPQLQHGTQLQPGFTIQPGGPQLQPGGPQLQSGGPQMLPADQLQQQISVLQQQIQQHQNMMDQQIKQSEQNLSAQYNSLMQQQQSQIEDTILQTQNEKIAKLYNECDIVEEEFDKAVQPIIESCTKDAILNGKSWIFQKAISDQHRTLVAQYLLKRITSSEASFELRLHLIYLINDLLHHCQRKNAGDMKKELESVVVPIFCISLVGAEEEKKTKLNKLLTLWEQNKYFEDDTIKQMREPSQSLSAFKEKVLKDHSSIASQISANIQQQYNSLQKQHQDFVNHMNMTQQQLQQQLKIITSLQQQSQTAGIPPNVVASLPPGVTSVVTATVPSSQAVEIVSSVATASVVPSLASSTSVAMAVPTTSLAGQGPPPGSMSLQDMPPGSSAPNYTQAPAVSTSQYQPSFSIHSHGFGAPHLGFQRPPLPGQFDFSQPPPTRGPGIIPPDFLGPPPQGPPQFALPDLSKPPPGYTGGPIPGGGFPPMLPPEIDLTPSVPYYELPAGLMAPLIKLEDFDYKPLDPNNIRLPPPMPPSERLLRAVEAFYSSPHHDRPRDSDGWEKLGLYEFFKAKQMARKRKDREGEYRRSRSRSRSLSKSPSPTTSPPPPEWTLRSRSPPSVRGDRNDINLHSPALGRIFNTGNKRRSLSRSRSRSRSRSNSGSRSGSGSYSPSRSMSKSESRSRSRSGSRSRSRSKSPLPYLPSSKSPSPVRRHRKSKSKSRSRSRSATPPTFSTEAFLAAAAAAANTSSQPPSSENRIGHENKGHQLLKKMGWSGKGLGASEQGIVEPISGGEVRDRQDMYKGVGHDFGDPFEQFRKNKSLGFIQRMKARDEQRELKRKATDSS